MDFVAIDVETANPDFSSICQVGVAAFQDGQMKYSWESLVDPEDYFSEMNISIHGIIEKTVRNAPKWTDVHAQLTEWMTDQVVVSHTSFDRTSLSRACTKNNLTPHNCTWLDSARVVKRTWPEFSKSGYGLGNIAKFLKIDFTHHNAKEDARAAGEVLIKAISESGIGIPEWLDRVRQSVSKHIPGAVNLDGLLFGERIVFTGALSMPRSEASDIAAAAGCEVDSNVTKHTTLLVVGDQDIQRLAPGQEKSSKHRKAEDLILKGQGIRIVGESDFQLLVGSSGF